VGELPVTTPKGEDPSPSPPTKYAPKERRISRRDDEPPVLPDVSRDDTDAAWGDASSERDDDWYRRERPPHHG
jgi:hypothetical protein